MRKLQSFLSKITKVLVHLKNQGMEYLQQIGEDRTITAADSIEWETGEESLQDRPVV